jgi:hypothetical protein
MKKLRKSIAGELVELTIGLREMAGLCIAGSP